MLIPGKVIIVELGLNKTETMLKQYQVFISARKICFWLFLVFLENCICVIIAVHLTGRAQMLTPWKNSNSGARTK